MKIVSLGALSAIQAGSHSCDGFLFHGSAFVAGGVRLPRQRRGPGQSEMVAEVFEQGELIYICASIAVCMHLEIITVSCEEE